MMTPMHTDLLRHGAEIRRLPRAPVHKAAHKPAHKPDHTREIDAPRGNSHVTSWRNWLRTLLTPSRSGTLPLGFRQ